MAIFLWFWSCVVEEIPTNSGSPKQPTCQRKNCGHCASKGLILQEKMERLQRKKDGKRSDAVAVFNGTVEYDGDSSPISVEPQSSSLPRLAAGVPSGPSVEIVDRLTGRWGNLGVLLRGGYHAL